MSEQRICFNSPANLSRQVTTFGRCVENCHGCVAIYWSWRYAYYQDLFSNTVYVKTEISAAFLERGLDYVLVQHLTFLPLLLNLPALVYALRRNRLAVGLPTAAMASGMVGYSILVGGDFMTMGRFLIPGLAFNAVLFGWMLSDLGRRPGPRRQVTTAAALAVITAGILPAWDIHPVPESFREKFHFRLNFTEYHSEYEMWEFQKLNEKMRGITGRALKAYAEPADSVVLGAIGAIGYYSEAFVIDRCGLVTRKIGNMARPGTTGSPGHDRCVPWKSLIQEEPDIPSFTLLPGSDIPGYVDRRIIDDWSPGTETRLSSRYAPDFVPVRDEENHTPDQYLFVIRKIREGQNPDAVWKEVHERARQLEGTGPGED